MVSARLPLVPSWPSRGLFEWSCENEVCLRLRVAGGEGGSSDSGNMTAEATTLEVGTVSETVVGRYFNMTYKGTSAMIEEHLKNSSCVKIARTFSRLKFEQSFPEVHRADSPGRLSEFNPSSFGDLLSRRFTLYGPLDLIGLINLGIRCLPSAPLSLATSTSTEPKPYRIEQSPSLFRMSRHHP